jgi:cupin 2 domain-containing protein
MTAMNVGNLFSDTSPPCEGERFQTLLAREGLVIERIVSSSRIASTMCMQEQDEWVVLLRGQAVLDVDGQRVPMDSADYVFLPSKTPHTVQSVSDGALWLAVHLHPRSKAQA